MQEGWGWGKVSFFFSRAARVLYPGSRGPFSKCLRFDKAPETLSLGALHLVDAALPRIISIDKKKISSGTQRTRAVELSKKSWINVRGQARNLCYRIFFTPIGLPSTCKQCICSLKLHRFEIGLQRVFLFVRRNCVFVYETIEIGYFRIQLSNAGFTWMGP